VVRWHRSEVLQRIVQPPQTHIEHRRGRLQQIVEVSIHLPHKKNKKR
jgi:hypothetical protein